MTFISDDIREYERLKVEAKTIATKIERLGASIAVFMDQEGTEETEELPMGGKIQCLYKKSWDYSKDPRVTEAVQALSDTEQRSRLEGIAKETVNPYIKYLPPKV